MIGLQEIEQAKLANEEKIEELRLSIFELQAENRAFDKLICIEKSKEVCESNENENVVDI